MAFTWVMAPLASVGEACAFHVWCSIADDDALRIQPNALARPVSRCGIRSAAAPRSAQCTRTVVSEYGARVIANDEFDTRVALCAIDELSSP